MNLLKSISLRQLLQGAVRTFRSYPLVLLAAILGTTIACWRIDLDYQEQQLYPYLDKLLLVSSLGLILFFVLELGARRYRLSGVQRVLLLAAGVAFLAMYYLLLPDNVEKRQFLRFLLLGMAFHLVASYVLFLNLRTQNAFWQFNRALFLRFLTAALYSAVLFLGLTIALAALRHLFGLSVPDVTYGRLWLVLVGIFNTWFFLAGVPEQVAELELEQHYPKGLKVFTQFVLLPLVALYLLILYLYLGKIMVQWEWPEGWVSVLVLCFSIAGILSLLLIHPIRNEAGNTWMRSFARWFYRALFPLIILLLLAIWRRVSEYGITEQRYVVLALALWLFCTAVYFLVSSRKNIKFIPVTLSVVALLGAFGPLNIFQVSAWSQKKRLEGLLLQHDILQGDKIVLPSGEVAGKAGAEISSIVRYMAEMQHLHKLQPWFKQDLDSLVSAISDSADYSWARTENSAEAIVAMLGVPYRSRFDRDDIYQYQSLVLDEKEEVWKLTGYDYIIADCRLRYNGSSGEEQHTYQLSGNPLTVSLRSAEAILEFTYYNEKLQINLQPYVLQAQLKPNLGHRPLSAAAMTQTAEGHRLAIKILIDIMQLDQKKAKAKISDLECAIFVKLPD